MDHRKYIQKRILVLSDSNRTFRFVSAFVLSLSVALFVAAFFSPMSNDFALKMADLAISLLILIIPLYLNSERAKRKIQIIELEHLLTAIEKDPQLLEADVLLRKILEKL